MNRYCRLLLLTVLCFLRLAAPAQTPVHYNYSVAEGLPGSETYDVMQDSRGFIWIATDRGVVRYDGYDFKVFTTNDGLPANTVFQVVEDQYKRLWFLSHHSHLCYYENNRIYPYRFNHLLEQQLSAAPNPRSIYCDKDSGLYVSYYEAGLIHIDTQGRVRNLVTGDNSYFTFFALTIGKTSLYGTRLHTLYKEKASVQVLTGAVYRQQKQADPGWTFSSGPLMNIRRKNAAQVISTTTALLEYPAGGKTPQARHASGIIRLYEDRDSCLWVCYARGGAKKLLPNTIDTGTTQLHVLRDKTVTGVLQDRDGGFWFTTLENGVYYFPHFRFFKANTPMSPQEDEVTAIATAPGAPVFVGYSKGTVEEINELTCTHSYNINQEQDPRRHVHSLWYDTAMHQLWCGLTNALFVRMPGKEFTLYYPRMVHTIYRDLKGRYFLAGLRELKIGMPPRDSIITAADTRVRIDDISGDNNGNILLASTTGLLAYNTLRGIYTPYPQLRQVRIRKIRKMPDGRIIYATLGKGVVIETRGQLKLFNSRTGKVPDFINAVTFAHDTIWAATTQGISRIVLRDTGAEVHNFNQYNGLPANDIREIEIKGSILWLGTRQGLYWVNTNSLSIQKTGPEVFIDKIIVEGRFVGNRNAFQYSENNFSFNFFAINYKMRGHIVYHYRLQGYNNNWQTTYNRNVQYLSLPYGKYCFEVRAENEDGHSSAESTRFTFTIFKPFYLEWWFLAACVLLVTAIVGFFVRRRIAGIQQRNKTRLLMNEYKGIALASQINPHFLFNSLNAIQSFILHEDRLTAARYLSSLARLMRKSLEHSRVDYVSVSDELDLLQAYLLLEQFRYKDLFQYRFDIDPLLDRDKTFIPSMILQPFIENSIKHGILPKKEKDGEVVIRLSREEGLLKCHIEDNGIGRKAAAAVNKEREGHRSQGIEITVERIKMYCLNEKSKFFFEITDKQNNTGTQVIFYLPYRQGNDET